MTQERLDGIPKSQTKFVKNRYLISGPFAFKFLGSLTVLLNLPCGILTSVDENLPQLQGDNCNRSWGDVLLGVYVAGYVCVFMWFAFKLRQVVDGFKIKEEMKITGAMGIFVFVPWIVFNTRVKSINNTVFPFSTLFLVLGASLAFVISTLYPLYRSLEPPTLEMDNVPEDISSLQGLLANKLGVASFKKFLTKEFSVENILFYEEIEDYRKKKANGAEDLELIGEAQRIYAKYIIVDSPFQVNLPDHIVKELENKLKEIFSNAGKIAEDDRPSNGGPPTRGHDRNLSEVPALPHQRDVPTIFDKAQENIFKLMSTDSFPRYQRSEEYRRFVGEVDEALKKRRILAEVGVTAEVAEPVTPHHVLSLDHKAAEP